MGYAMTTNERPQRPDFSAVRTALLARTLAGLLLVGLIISLVLNMVSRNTSDHYTPPTTPGDHAPLKVGETAPDFTLPNADGEPVSLTEFRGKPTILLFFRTFG
jgi:cytochrome oxidase Cu insertion factor (SCO1/SenC/PrrC family)